MKITGIEMFRISVPFAKPYKLSKLYGTLTHANAVIFKVHTDVGIVGLGEADPMNPFTDETPSSVMAIVRDVIAPNLTGQDPTRISRIESILDQAVYGNLTARGAISMALYDITGKANNVPAHTLLGGLNNETLPLLGPIGSGTPDEDTVAIEELLEQGFGTVMIKMGTLPVADEVKRLANVQKRFGEQISVIVDANQGWDVGEALVFTEETREFRPALIEQPVKRRNIDGLKRIRERTISPLCADESLVSIHDATTLIQNQAVDAFSIKVSKNGGITKAFKIAHLADAFGIRCLMNSMLEFGITQAASLQTGCTLTNLLDMGHAYMSVLRMSDDITDFAGNISRAVVTVPSAPGLGVALNEDKLKKYTLEELRV
ncbi:MAG: mandelate racemase [Desulfobacterales bacterium]|nr:mandelate racemase [Desulfobacterales bacterium]